MARPHLRQPGRGLPHPPRRGPWPLVPRCLLGSQRPARDPARHAAGRWRDGRGHQRGPLAAWLLDQRGNPLGAPRRFGCSLSGTAQYRDARLRHALTRLLYWAGATGVQAIAVEVLRFTDSKTREKHGRKKKFRRRICGIPTGRLRARLLSMCAQAGISVIVVDPAYTSMGARNTGRSR